MTSFLYLYLAPLLPLLLCAVSSPGPNVTLEGQYHCHQGPGIPLDKLCDFSTDCPLGDDEGNLCREYTTIQEHSC